MGAREGTADRTVWDTQEDKEERTPEFVGGEACLRPKRSKGVY